MERRGSWQPEGLVPGHGFCNCKALTAAATFNDGLLVNALLQANGYFLDNSPALRFWSGLPCQAAVQCRQQHSSPQYQFRCRHSRRSCRPQSWPRAASASAVCHPSQPPFPLLPPLQYWQSACCPRS